MLHVVNSLLFLHVNPLSVRRRVVLTIASALVVVCACRFVVNLVLIVVNSVSLKQWTTNWPQIDKHIDLTMNA